MNNDLFAFVTSANDEIIDNREPNVEPIVPVFESSVPQPSEYEGMEDLIADVTQFDKGDSLKFTLKDVDISVANGIRRVLISEVPSMAIELVRIPCNNTPIHDEQLSHRLGLIPLKCGTGDFETISEFLFPEECDCESLCTRCTVHYNLDVTNEEQEPITVTTADLITTDERVLPVHYDKEAPFGMGVIPIVKLAPGQSIKLQAIAQKGIGRDHMKFSPIVVAAYTYETENEYVDPDEFFFTIETDGSVTAKSALKLSLQILSDKIQSFKDDIEMFGLFNR